MKTISLYKFDFHSKNEQTMEVIAIQKSALDGMKNELKTLLELTENATQKYMPIFKKEQWLANQEVCLLMNIILKMDLFTNCNEWRNLSFGRGCV